jgi:hypothetical protein
MIIQWSVCVPAGFGLASIPMDDPHIEVNIIERMEMDGWIDRSMDGSMDGDGRMDRSLDG